MANPLEKKCFKSHSLKVLAASILLIDLLVVEQAETNLTKSSSMTNMNIYCSFFFCPGENKKKSEMTQDEQFLL